MLAPEEVRMPLSGSTIRTATNRSLRAPEVDRVVEWSLRFPQPEQKSAEWKNQRAYYCTASQHASALGRCKYKSRNECLRQYAGVIRNNFTGNVATRHGERYEDEAVAKYKALRNVDVLHFGMLPFYEQSTWLGGSPDGISTDGCLIEVKCPWKRKPNGKVPPHYIPQIQSMMHGLDLRVCHFIEYVPATQWKDETFDIIEVPRDEGYWTVALPLLQTFWDEVNVLRDTVTEDITFGDQKADSPPQKKSRPPPSPVPCNIVLTKPTHNNNHNNNNKRQRLYTADTLPMPFLAQFCTQGLGGTANLVEPRNPRL